MGLSTVTQDVSRKNKYFSPILEYFEAWLQPRSYGDGVMTVFVGLNCVGWIPGMQAPAPDFATGYLLRKKYTKVRRVLEVDVKLNHSEVMRVTTQEEAVTILRVALERIFDEVNSLNLAPFDVFAFRTDLLEQLDQAAWITQPLPQPTWPTDKAEPIMPLTTALALPKFWMLIVHTGEATAYAPEAQCALLVEHLAALPAKQIIGFEVQLRRLLKRLYHYNALAVAKLLEGHVSDDSFLYFCCAVILRGPALFSQVLRQPNAITAEWDASETGEGLLGVSDAAFELKFGPDTDRLLPQEYGLAVHDYNAPDVEMAGQDWETDDLTRRFPKLALRYPLPPL